MNRRFFAIAFIIGIWEPLFAQPMKGSPGMEQNDPDFDRPLTQEQLHRIEQLSASDVTAIDQTLLSNALPEWRKVARIVAMSMNQLPSRVIGIPDIYYSHRVAELVKNGKLESQGDLRRMRYSEVRLPSK